MTVILLLMALSITAKSKIGIQTTGCSGHWRLTATNPATDQNSAQTDYRTFDSSPGIDIATPPSVFYGEKANVTLDEALVKLYQQGIINMETVIKFCREPDEISRTISYDLTQLPQM